MSSVFSGVLVAKPLRVVRQMIGQLSQVVPLRVVEISSGLSAIMIDEMIRGIEVGSMPQLAAMISGTTDALVVIYDNRTGNRTSALYRRSNLVHEFGPDDEMYVPLTDDGSPTPGAQAVSASELAEGTEYETSINAIQLGLRQIQCEEQWEQLKQFIDMAPM